MGVKIMKRMHKLGMCLGILMLILPAALAFSQNTFNYRSYLHFDPELLDYKLKVRIFGNKAEYDRFLQDVIGETRSSFVFFHYPDPKKSELVAYHLDDQN